MTGLLLVGAGPGLGVAVARRFAVEGLPVTLVARRQASLDAMARELSSLAVPVRGLVADSTDEAGIRTAIDRTVDEFGPPDAVVYNAAIIQADAPGDLSARRHLDAYAVNVVGALTVATHVAPSMIAAGGGSVILTGGMPEPVAAYLSLSIGKAGVRALTAMLHEYYGPHGIHAATVTVWGGIAPGSAFDPHTIAEQYWRLHRQPRAEWETEVAFTGAEAAESSGAASARSG